MAIQNGIRPKCIPTGKILVKPMEWNKMGVENNSCRALALDFPSLGLVVWRSG